MSQTDAAEPPFADDDGMDFIFPPPDETGSALFGRRKGKKLRQHQAGLVDSLLPHLALDLSRPIDPAALFEPALEALRLEIGFGGGEHLIAEARRHPEIGFIGCEPFVNGMAKALAAIEEHGLTNIRLHMGDATDVLARLPDACLDGVDLLYPDPWPKRRQRKRRFVSETTIASFARVLRPSAEFHFATDIDDYAGWTLARVLRAPEFTWLDRTSSDWLTPWDRWEGTRYEAKAHREGRRPVYLTFRRLAA
jgi:tRNA (guanine-N7-)-methyltransferase